MKSPRAVVACHKPLIESLIHAWDGNNRISIPGDQALNGAVRTNNECVRSPWFSRARPHRFGLRVGNGISSLLAEAAAAAAGSAVAAGAAAAPWP